MATFWLSKQVCDELDSIVRRFWWGPKHNNSNFLTLKSWIAICLPKENGGLGFRQFVDFNIALLANLGWKIAWKERSLWTDLISKKYLKGNSYFSYQPTRGISQVWRRIISFREALMQGACFCWEMDSLLTLCRTLKFQRWRDTSPSLRKESMAATSTAW